MATTSIRLESSDEFPGGPVSACVEIPPGDGGLTLVEESSGSRKAAQAGGPGRMVWIEGPLAAGESRSYSVESEKEGGGGVEITDSGEGSLDVSVGGEPFTSYRHGPEWFRPYFHPVLGPHGLPVTRGFPMVADVPGETSDHPHHKGIWSAYGEAGHVDNWAEAETSGRTLHRGFETVESGLVFGRFVAIGDWVGHDGGPAVLAERRTVTVYATAPHRLFDYELALTATGSDVLFGDTKEGGFISLRVATSMDVSANGRLENSRGGVGETDVWGKRAEWCDYSGPVDGRTVGVAFLEDPSSFGHPTYWHSRDYGLMSANPFGLSEFLGEGHCGDYVLPAGETIVFSYRVYIHEGDAAEGQVDAVYRAYTAPPSVQSS